MHVCGLQRLQRLASQAMWAVGKPVVLPKSVAPFVGLFVQGDSVEVHEIVSTGENEEPNAGAGVVRMP